MADLKQQLNAIDYFGVVAVWLCFFSIVFIFSVTCINCFFIRNDDDITVFESYGMKKFNRRLPAHRAPAGMSS